MFLIFFIPYTQVALDLLIDAVQASMSSFPYVQFQMQRFGFACAELWSVRYGERSVGCIINLLTMECQVQ